MNRFFLISVWTSIFLVVVFIASLVFCDWEAVLDSKETSPIPAYPKPETSIPKAVIHDTSQVKSDSMESIGMNTSVMDEEKSTNSQEILNSPLFYYLNTTEYSHLSESQQSSLNIIMQKYIIFHNKYNSSIFDKDEWERQVHEINMELVNSLGSDITDKLFRGGGSD